MNINSLIQGFGAYLEELNKTQNGKYNTKGTNVSIFMYANEFKNYLSQNVKTDVPISSMSINDILNMEIVNGKLTEEDELINPFEDEENNTKTEETVPTEEKTAEQDKDASVKDILNDLFNDDLVKEVINTDEDEELSKEEIADFLNIIKGLDENTEDISIEDILAAVIAIQDGTFDLLKAAAEQEQTTPVDTEIPSTDTTPANTTSGGTGGVGGSSGGSGNVGGGTGSSNSSVRNNSPQTKTIDNMKSLFRIIMINIMMSLKNLMPIWQNSLINIKKM